MQGRTLVGITSDLIERTQGRWSCAVGLGYCEAVAEAGGVPVLMPPLAELAAEHARRFDAFVFTGGNDPDMRRWGIENHPEAKLMDPRRQAYELELLRLLREEHSRKAVLGICLGMQMMCLDAGGSLHQHLPDVVKSADAHRDADHVIKVVVGREDGCPDWLAEGGMCSSNHHQGILSPGPNMQILATGEDGVIEAVRDASRKYYVGVQWHPERTKDVRLGMGVFREFVAAGGRG
jgi:putative glutamine amidotransferase